MEWSDCVTNMNMFIEHSLQLMHLEYIRRRLRIRIALYDHRCWFGVHTIPIMYLYWYSASKSMGSEKRCLSSRNISCWNQKYSIKTKQQKPATRVSNPETKNGRLVHIGFETLHAFPASMRALHCHGALPRMLQVNLEERTGVLSGRYKTILFRLIISVVSIPECFCTS